MKALQTSIHQKKNMQTHALLYQYKNSDNVIVLLLSVSTFREIGYGIELRQEMSTAQQK